MKTYSRISPIRAGVTMTELIVVISLAAMVLGITIPSISAMRRSNQKSGATNTITAAITAARVYTGVGKADLQDMATPIYAGFTYSGVAIVFTPAGELRLVENNQKAQTSLSAFLEPDRNGYSDIPGRDYIRLPRDAGVVGIARGGSGNGTLYLFTPPFAIRFNENGHLIAGITGERLVYYDGDQDNNFGVSTQRSAGYDPDDYDPSLTSVTTVGGINTFPIEEIETVIGVIVYSKSELREAIPAGHIAENSTRFPINAAAQAWLLDPDNSKTIFFSRYSGTRMMR